MTLTGAPLAVRFEVVLRSGCYLVHDSDYYRELIVRLLARSPEMAPTGEGLLPALELWACVHSRPEPGRVIVGLGKRDASFDINLPRPLKWARSRHGGVLPLDGHRTVRLDDQHAYLDVPANSPLSVGDLVAFGISHPCTTFDRWKALYIVDENLTVTGAIKTYF
jgi:D-serine dehydratase